MRVLTAFLIASAALAATPTLHTPLPMDHDLHAPWLKKAEMGCMDCHVGGDFTPPIPAPSCHGCHLGETPRAPRKAPSSCTTCHAVREELLPTDHLSGWLTQHGQAARAAARRCADCHEDSSCLGCHDRRGAGAASPHGPGFSSLHGLDARMDPASCTSCHTGETCTACHSTGATPL